MMQKKREADRGGNDGKEVEEKKRGQNKRMSERRAGEMEADWVH